MTDIVACAGALSGKVMSGYFCREEAVTVTGREKRYFIGIDTSNYTTSAAAVDEAGKVIAFSKRLLPVRDGGAGLRQSEAVFSHVRQISAVVSELASQLTGCGEMDSVGMKPAAVGYSARPRDVEGSYMPCFLVGESTALSLSSVCGIPAYDFSHQAGHLAAALYGCGEEKLQSEPFYAFHVSGGTTGILEAAKDGKITLLGGTKDISAGQLIDRAGIMLGMHFPCGPELEKAAAAFSAGGGQLSSVPIVCVRGLNCNLSGIENKLSGLKDDGHPDGEIALYAITAVWLTLQKLTQELLRAYGERPVLYAGGVMSCSYIKEMLKSHFDAYFAPPELSSDNAAGTAILCRKRYISENGRV